MRATLRERYGPWAIVAGASEGLGAAFVRRLAAEGFHVVAVARRAAMLEALAAELRAAHGVELRCLALDLASPQLPAHLLAATADLDVGLVVYNAALSLIGPFLSQSLDDKLRVIDVNCRGPLVFADHFGRRLAERGRGALVLMSSLAGSQGSPLVATYAATKAFNLVLGEGLWEELGHHGVDVLACRAGAIRTPAYEATAPARHPPLQEAAEVVDEALRALGRKPSVVTGFVNRLGAFFLGRILPRRTAIHIMASSTRRMYPGHGMPSLPRGRKPGP